MYYVSIPTYSAGRPKYCAEKFGAYAAKPAPDAALPPTDALRFLISVPKVMS